MRPGPRNLITDVGGLVVGNAADARHATGVTVLTAAEPFPAALHVMGGAPGTRESDLLGADKLVSAVDALVLAGGSAFGLGACEGVMEGLRTAGRGYPVGPVRVPIVPGAIIFDLMNGGDKDWAVSPYPALGRSALAAAGEDFALGTAGAGYGATTGRWKGGLGSASAVLASGITVGALAVVNALGSATVGEGAQFWAAPWEEGEEFGALGPAPRPPPGEAPLPGKPLGAATTIAVVATDAVLDKAALQRVAVAAHDGIGRALVPAHTLLDGDLVYALATGRRDCEEPLRDLFQIGHAAAVCLSRAIARAVYLATPLAGDRQECWSSRQGGRGPQS